MNFENWLLIINIIYLTIFLIIGVYKFQDYVRNRKKKFGSYLKIDSQYCKGTKFNLIKKKDNFEWSILKFMISNIGSETARIKNLIFMISKEEVKPKVILAWDESIHVKEQDYMVGQEFWKGIMSLPRLAVPFSLKPQETITLFILVKPKNDYLKYKEILAKFYLHIFYSNKELHWGPISLFWAQKKSIDEINKKEISNFLKKIKKKRMF